VSELVVDGHSSTVTSGDDPEAKPWWRSAVVYQIYPRSFADSDGDGIGDLRGIVQRLDHLETLGVDAIWLSPIYVSPHDDNGYDISDYQAIDPVFGTMDDFDELVAEVHRRGMRIIMDLVVNHTSDEHQWFVESASGPDSPKRDWYWWRPARPGFEPGTPGAEPTNWESFFSGSTWEYHEATGEYYLHLFSRKQPDLNWENPEVRAAVHAVMRWWLDRGIDGFRMDVINLISKDPRLPDGPAAPGAAFGNGFVHYGYGPRIHEFLREMHDAVFADRPGALLTVGEMPGVTVEQARRFTDPSRRELDMVFQFEHVNLDHGAAGKWQPQLVDVVALKQSLARWQTGLAQVGWNSLYWNNHDQPRVLSRFGDDRRYPVQSATALATVLHLLRGTPYIYQGEEIGMTNVPFDSVDDFRDIESINYYRYAVSQLGRSPDEVLLGMRASSRDNARTPLQWDDSDHAGFTAGTPWIPVHPNYVTVNAAAQRGIAGSVLEHYRSLIRLRHTEPAVVLGDFRLLLPDHPAVFAYVRTYRGTRLLVLANLSSEARSVDLPESSRWAGADVLIGNYEWPGSTAARFSGGRAGLRPWEAQVLRAVDRRPR
jgi:oligo-1,6-glucosidase